MESVKTTDMRSLSVFKLTRRANIATWSQSCPVQKETSLQLVRKNKRPKFRQTGGRTFVGLVSLAIIGWFTARCDKKGGGCFDSITKKTPHMLVRRGRICKVVNQINTQIIKLNIKRFHTSEIKNKTLCQEIRN